MPIKDTFPRSDRWNSVGLYCSKCVHIKNNIWPNLKRNLACKLHKISLEIELNSSNRLEGEWFCKKYRDNGETNAAALKEFFSVRDQLKDKVLYRFDSPGTNLIEIPFTYLNK